MEDSRRKMPFVVLEIFLLEHLLDTKRAEIPKTFAVESIIVTE